MTTKEVEEKLRQAAAKLKKHVDERKDEVMTRVFKKIKKEQQ